MKKDTKFLLNVKRTWKYAKSAKYHLFCYGIVSIVDVVLSALTPLFGAKIIVNMNAGIMNELLMSTILVAFLESILHLMNYLKAFFYRRVYSDILINIQSSLAKEILSLQVSEIDKNSSGLFIDRINKDTADIAGIFMEYTYWISYVLSNVGVLIAIYIINKYIFCYCVVVAILVYLINRKRIEKQTIVQKELKKYNEKKTGFTSELVRGIRDIKVLNATDKMLSETIKKIRESAKKEIDIMNIRNRYSLLERNVRSFTDVGLIYLGIHLYSKGLLSIPSFVIVYNYQNKVKNLLTGIVYISEFNKKFAVSSERIYEIIESEKFKKETFGKKNIKKLSGSIEFKNVSFGYNDDNLILNNMNFKINSNERVGFVGKSGVGKSTIFNLITKLYNATDGNILLDGMDINNLTNSSIRDNMSIITQSPYIFNFTIKENLLIAKPTASMKEIREVCKLACIDDYIMSLDDKYETMVGENGVILSGGQKQRLAIARALLMQTEIILFDEATSALDNETQSKIQEAIDNLKGKYTILIIAHRLSTIVDCDKIFFMDGGKIVASGTHRELLENCDEYKKLYESEIQDN